EQAWSKLNRQAAGAFRGVSRQGSGREPAVRCWARAVHSSSSSGGYRLPKLNILWSMEQCSFEPVGYRRTARAAHVARAGRRVSAEGRTGNGSLGCLPRASNSQLKTGTNKGNLTV
nr:regulator of rDNA transcription protein 15 [Tanacetum cinerariifolium]